MQLSRHSSGISISATAFLTSIGSGSDGSADAICTSGISASGSGDGSDSSASTINFDSSLATGASVATGASAAIAVSGSATAATSALMIVRLPIGRAVSAGSGSAVSNAAGRTSTGTAAVVSTSAGPTPSRPPHQAATTTVPHITATFANRCGLMSVVSKGLHRSHVCDGTSLSDPYGRARAQTSGHDVFEKVLPKCTA